MRLHGIPINSYYLFAQSCWSLQVSDTVDLADGSVTYFVL